MIHANLKNFDQYFEKIIRNAKRLEKLTEDILDFSRIEGKNLQLSKSNFDLNQTIQQVIEDYQKEASEKGVKITFELKIIFPFPLQYMLMKQDCSRLLIILWLMQLVLLKMELLL